MILPQFRKAPALHLALTSRNNKWLSHLSLTGRYIADKLLLSRLVDKQIQCLSQMAREFHPTSDENQCSSGIIAFPTLRTSSSTDLNFEFEPNPLRGVGGIGVSISNDGFEGRAIVQSLWFWVLSKSVRRHAAVQRDQRISTAGQRGFSNGEWRR